MAKPNTDAIGIDLGHHSIKAVAISKKGANRYIVNGYSSIAVEGELQTVDELALYLKQTLKRVGGVGKKTIGLAINPKNKILKTIEQPETPLTMLRDVLKLNAKSLLDQDVTGYVLDCDFNEREVVKVEGEEEQPVKKAQKRKFLVGGMESQLIDMIWGACEKEKFPVKLLQLAPVAIFNAYEFAQPEIFSGGTSLLVDIGHKESTLLVASHKQLALVRNVEFSGEGLIAHLTADGSSNAETVMNLLQQADPSVLQIADAYISGLAREITNSIGFFEGSHEEGVQKVLISGGLAASQPLLQTLVGYIEIPCELWNPLQQCEVPLPQKTKEIFEVDFINLATATGAAVQQFRET